MRKNFISVLCIIMALIVASCSDSKLTRDEAAKLIKEYYGYPSVFDYEVSCGDPGVAKKFLDAGLEEEGWVTIRKRGTMVDTTPFITFTEKAAPYLLPTAPEAARYKNQNVKMYETHFEAITSLSESPKGTAVAVYRISKTNTSPFVAAYPNMAKNKEEEKRAYFRKFDNGWQIDKTAEIDFIR